MSQISKWEGSIGALAVDHSKISLENTGLAWIHTDIF